MKKPDINDPKYLYYHLKMGKRIFNNKKYLADCKKYEEKKIEFINKRQNTNQ